MRILPETRRSHAAEPIETPEQFRGALERLRCIDIAAEDEDVSEPSWSSAYVAISQAASTAFASSSRLRLQFHDVKSAADRITPRAGGPRTPAFVPRAN